MPSRYPAEVRTQVVDLTRSGTRVAQLPPQGMVEDIGFQPFRLGRAPEDPRQEADCQ